jgi:hypothetical protein
MKAAGIERVVRSVHGYRAASDSCSQQSSITTSAPVKRKSARFERFDCDSVTTPHFSFPSWSNKTQSC